MLSSCPDVLHAQSAEIEVYTGDVTSPGAFNLTVHNNYIARGARAGDFAGAIVPDASLTGGTEWAYGATPWLEYGVYLPIYTLDRDRKLHHDGTELRALFVVPEAAEQRFVYGINVAFQFDSRAFSSRPVSLELRPIYGANLGSWHLTVNPIVDTTFDGKRQIRFSPAERAQYTFTQHWSAGLEEYSDLGSLGRFDELAKQMQVLFAVCDYKSGPWSVEVGLGGGLTHASDALTLKLIVSRDLPRFR